MRKTFPSVMVNRFPVHLNVLGPLPHLNLGHFASINTHVTDNRTWSPSLKGADPTSPDVSSKSAPWFRSTKRFIGIDLYLPLDM